MKMRRPKALLLGAGIGLAALGVLVYALYRQDLDAARARVATGSEIAETRCGPIEHAAVGEGPAVLLVHGAGGGFDQTLPAARELAARGFRVVSPSRFGYLRTPHRADATPAAQADAHACLLDTLHLARAAVVGVSAGAPSAMQLALRHRERVTALVLLVPLAYAPEGGFRGGQKAGGWLVEQLLRSDFLYWLVVRAAPALVQRVLLGTPPALVARAETAERDRVEWLARQPLPVSARTEGLLNDAAVAARLERYELERIAAPTLVIAAADDLWGVYGGARYSAQHIPGARLLALSDGGHLWVGHHREVMGEIGAFLGAKAR